MKARVCVVLLMAGCSVGGTLECSFFEGDNCFKQTLAAASSCLPASGDQGALSADNRTCTYASGQVVTFDSPVVLSSTAQPTAWKFTVTSGGAQCLRWESVQEQSTKLVTRAGTYTSGDGGGFSLTCPDGRSYSTSNAFALLSCGGDGGLGLFTLPGFTYSTSSSAVVFSLTGAGTADGVQKIFECQK